MNHYPKHVGDWMVATAHLTEIEECMYSRMLDSYYAREAPLPLDVAACCRLVRASSVTAKKAVNAVLHEFFTEMGDGWHQKRADQELAAYHAKAAKASESACARWGKRDANAMRTHSERNANQNQNQEPRTTKSKATSTSLTQKPARKKLESPTVEHEQIAAERGISCQAEFQKYRDWLASSGKRHIDQVAGFRNWLRNAKVLTPRVIAGRDSIAGEIFGGNRGPHETDISAQVERLA